MAASPQADLTTCPFCPHAGSRTDVHAHMVDAHADRVEAWTDAETGRMRYRVQCPRCSEAHEQRVKPRSRDPAFLEAFRREISLVAFDMLLNHMEASHEDGLPEEGGPASGPLPAYGPGGGSGAPGTKGIPVPPGMEGSEPPAIPGHPRPPRPQGTDSHDPGGAE